MTAIEHALAVAAHRVFVDSRLPTPRRIEEPCVGCPYRKKLKRRRCRHATWFCTWQQVVEPQVLVDGGLGGVYCSERAITLGREREADHVRGRADATNLSSLTIEPCELIWRLGYLVNERRLRNRE